MIVNRTNNSTNTNTPNITEPTRTKLLLYSVKSCTFKWTSADGPGCSFQPKINTAFFACYAQILCFFAPLPLKWVYYYTNTFLLLFADNKKNSPPFSCKTGCRVFAEASKPPYLLSFRIRMLLMNISYLVYKFYLIYSVHPSEAVTQR